MYNDEMDVDHDDVGLPDVEPDPPAKREICDKCRRPITVCWCPYLPNPLPDIKSRVIVLQHPYELKRSLSTTPMLKYGLPHDKCFILNGTRFDTQRFPVLEEAISEANTILLYPNSKAINIESLPKQPYQLIVLDGTWMQAKGLYGKNSFLRKLTTVKVPQPPLSKYVVRTQPTDECLSTLESVALALEIIEEKPDLFEVMTKPLTALCDFQLAHGAVEHQSKEYLIKNGLHKSQKEK